MFCVERVLNCFCVDDCNDFIVLYDVLCFEDMCGVGIEGWIEYVV